MFAKLMKYEWKDSMRVFLPLWGATVALGAVNGFTMGSDVSLRNPVLNFIVQILPALLLFGLSFGMFVVAFVLIIRRFYNGLLGDGGILSFTLPVTAAQHLAAKLLMALIMLVGCVLAGLLASVVLIAIRGDLGRVKELFLMLRSQLDGYRFTVPVIIEMLLFCLLAAAFSVLRLYSGMAIGHLFRTHRALWSVAAVLVMGWIFNYLTIQSGKILYNIADRTPQYWNIDSFSALLDRLPLFLGIGIGGFLLGSVLLWLLTHYILGRKLNIL